MDTHKFDFNQDTSIIKIVSTEVEYKFSKLGFSIAKNLYFLSLESKKHFKKDNIVADFANSKNTNIRDFFNNKKCKFCNDFISAEDRKCPF